MSYERSEGFFKGYDEARLFFQVWHQQNPRGTILITHGQGEHSDCYQRLVNAFKEDSWTFYSWDLRGHGRSDGKRGYVAEFNEYCQDYEIFVQKVLQDPKRPQGPVLLLGHSMGGLIQLKTILRNPAWLGQINGQICSAPFLGLALSVPAIKTTAAGYIKKFLPRLTLYNEVKNDMLTRDLDVIREYELDALRHNRISSGAFLGSLDSIEFVTNKANEISLPTLFVLPENDPVANTPSARKVFDQIQSNKKELFLYPDARHELFNDINRQTVFADVRKFTDSFLGES